MREDRGGKGGTVINVSSVAALIQVSPTAFVYAGTKSAVLYFSTCIGVSLNLLECKLSFNCGFNELKSIYAL